MADFFTQVAASKQLTIDEQKKAGTPVKGSMNDEYKNFLKVLKELLDSGEIDPYVPKSFLKMDVYESLSEELQEKTDLLLMNLAHQVRMIHDYIESKDTPAESPQLTNMVDHLWNTKQQIEKDHDVFKF